MRDYTRIKAWQLIDELVLDVYEASREFPKEELYGLTSQLRRAAVSAAANVVEGASRESKRDYLHFLHISRGSLLETQYYIHLSQRLGYMSRDLGRRLERQTQGALGCLQGLVKAVAKDAADPEQPDDDDSPIEPLPEKLGER